MWVETKSSGAPSADAARCRVLVVEDDPSSRRALMALLRLKGFEATCADSVAKAMRQLELDPGCVLLDLMLPDGNGAAVLEHIRAHRLPIRVAVMTGASNWQALLDNGRLQPEALFTKPLDLNQLIEWLERGT